MEDIELGTLLKKARQEKELTLSDIQERTKIRKKYLQAIEENNFDLLPGQVYLKVFVKGYAREVDINYRELLKYYPILTAKEEQETNLDKDYLGGTKIPHNKNKIGIKKTNIIKIVVIVSLSLFLIAAGIYAYQYFNSSEIRLLNQSNAEQEKKLEDHSEIVKLGTDSEQEVNNKQKLKYSIKDNNLEQNISNSIDSDLLSSQTEKLIGENILKNIENDSLNEDDEKSEIVISEDIFINGVDSKQDLNNKQRKNNLVNFESNKNNKLSTQEQINENLEKNSKQDQKNKQKNQLQKTQTVKFTADKDVWVNIKINNENSFSGILKAGNSKKFDFNNNLYIKIGKADAVRAIINGVEYGPWKDKAGIAEIEMIAEDNQVKVNNLRKTN